jgi:rare lipoprotein A
MEYKIQAGDTVTSVTQRLGTDWNTLKKANPAAVGKSKKTGDWIVKAGKTVSVPSSFEEILAQQTAQQTGKGSFQKNGSQKQTSASPGEIVHVLKKGENIWDLASKRYKVDPAEILRLNKISNPTSLQIGQKIRIPKENNGVKNAGEEVVASWYGKQHQGRTMANGAPFDMYGATIAHRDIAIGTTVELENPETGEKAKAVVTDRGPFAANRDVDLSYGLAKRLSLARQGVGNLKMRIL